MFHAGVCQYVCKCVPSYVEGCALETIYVCVKVVLCGYACVRLSCECMCASVCIGECVCINLCEFVSM